MLTACHNDQRIFASQKEFDEYVSENETDYVVKSETSEFTFEGMMLPPIEGDTLEQRLFRLRIGLNDGGNVLDYDKGGNYLPLEKEGYLSFAVINDVFLEVDGKELQPVLHHYERNYGIKPTVDLVFFFNKVRVKSEINFCYRDQLFGQGLVKMKYKKELFTNCYVKQ